jgi:hypothetical protein
MSALESLRWYEQTALIERRPVPQKLTDTERLDWLGEHCDLDKSHYQRSTSTTSSKFVIYDLLGQRTKENTLRDAIDMAAEKFRRANGE